MYYGDIVVFSKNVNNHMAHLQQILKMLRDGEVTRKL